MAVNHTADGTVIRLKGEAGVGCAGALLNGLLAPAACRPAVVTIDLSELNSISCLAVGVLAAYRRGVVRTGGRVRLTGELQPAVKDSLVRARLYELFEPAPAPAPPSESSPGSEDVSQREGRCEHNKQEREAWA